MKQLQSPFSKTADYLSSSQSYTAPQNDLSKATNKETNNNDSKNSKNVAELNAKQAEHKQQDTSIDNSEMNLSDPDAQKKAVPKEDSQSFSLVEYFKSKAREKLMNQVTSSTEDSSTPDAAATPKDNTPSAQNPKRAPKPTPPNNKLEPPTPSRPSPKFAMHKTPKTSIPKVSIPKPRMR